MATLSCWQVLTARRASDGSTKNDRTGLKAMIVRRRPPRRNRPEHKSIIVPPEANDRRSWAASAWVLTGTGDVISVAPGRAPYGISLRRSPTPARRAQYSQARHDAADPRSNAPGPASSPGDSGLNEPNRIAVVSTRAFTGR